MVFEPSQLGQRQRQLLLQTGMPLLGILLSLLSLGLLLLGQSLSLLGHKGKW